MARQTAEQYEKNLSRLRAFDIGTVKEQVLRPPNDTCLYGTLEVVARNEAAPTLAGKLIALAIATEGYLTVNTFPGECHFQIGIATTVEDDPQQEAESAQ